MTTLVIVQTHCSDKEEVVVNISTEYDEEYFILQQGETRQWNVWGDKAILVRERFKQGE